MLLASSLQNSGGTQALSYKHRNTIQMSEAKQGMGAL